MIYYLIMAPEDWAAMPNERNLACNNMKFITGRFTRCERFQTKATALAAMQEGQLLIREAQLSRNSWHYQKIYSA